MGELNLVPYELKQKKISKIQQKKYILYGVFGLILLLVAIAAPELRFYMLNREKASLEAQIAAGAAILNESNQIKNQIDSINQYTSKVDLLSKQRVIVSSRVKGLSSYVPQDIVFKTLGYSNGIISITGATKNYNSISELGANLQMSKDYKKATISNINYNQQIGEYTFSITIEKMGEDKNEKTK